MISPARRRSAPCPSFNKTYGPSLMRNSLIGQPQGASSRLKERILIRRIKSCRVSYVRGERPAGFCRWTWTYPRTFRIGSLESCDHFLHLFAVDRWNGVLVEFDELGKRYLAFPDFCTGGWAIDRARTDEEHDATGDMQTHTGDYLVSTCVEAVRIRCRCEQGT